MTKPTLALVGSLPKPACTVAPPPRSGVAPAPDLSPSAWAGHEPGESGRRLDAVSDDGTLGNNREASWVSFPLDVIDKHRCGVTGVRLQALKGDRLGRHGLSVVTQDTVEAMGQITFTIDQSEKVRGTGGGAERQDGLAISLHVACVHLIQAQFAYAHCDCVACRRWCRASEPTGVGFRVTRCDGHAVGIDGASIWRADTTSNHLRMRCHRQGDQCRQCGDEGRQAFMGGGGGESSAWSCLQG